MSSIEMKKISKKRQKSLASTLRTTHASAASATSAVPAAAVAHPSPQSASLGSVQPASTTTDQSIRAPSIDQPMLPATLLPVTEHEFFWIKIWNILLQTLTYMDHFDVNN